MAILETKQVTDSTMSGVEKDLLGAGGGDGPGGGGQGPGGEEGGGLKENSTGGKVTISDALLTFMHSWFQGNNQQEIIKLAMSSFTPVQLSAGARLISEKLPEAGKFIAHRDSPGRSASEMFATDILKVFQTIDSKGLEVVFCCSSVSMRSVKVSTMLFSEEEPIIAHKMAMMEKCLSDLLEGQQTLFKLVGEKLEPGKAPATLGQHAHQAPAVPLAAMATPTLASAPSYAASAARAVQGSSGIQRNQFGQPRSKRINSVVEDNAFEETDEESWEISAEEKRREKLKKRSEDRRQQAQEEAQRRRQEEKKKPKFIVGTGSKLTDKEGDCPGQAAPKHVFVARTAMSTTKDTVEGCLEYLAGIKGTATCCTPQERIDSGEAFSLSWRVQIDSADFEKALLPASWKTGWAVKPYYFKRKRPDMPAGHRDHLNQLLAQAGLPGHLRQNRHP